MALSRLRCGKDPLSTVLSRFNLSANGTALQPWDPHRQAGATEIGTKLAKNAASVRGAGAAHLHVSGVRRYPAAPRLPLPSNVSEIFGNETGRFTPERSRDIAAPALACAMSQGGPDQRARQGLEEAARGWQPASTGDRRVGIDVHVESYDCFGAVSLNGSMQTNVPSPYCSSGRSSHFNMPGGQWAKDSKYIAEDMQRSHYTRVKAPRYRGKRNEFDDDGPVLTNAATARLTSMGVVSRVEFSTDSSASKSKVDKDGEPGGLVDDGASEAPLTKVQRLKKAVKDYGGTVIVFHVGVSLISLGVCYVAVSSGLDLGSLVKTTLNGDNEYLEKAIAGSSTFLVAYAVHKVFAPVRISITLGATPFIVRYLRRVGFLKTPKP